MKTTQKIIYALIVSMVLLALLGCGEQKKTKAVKAPPPLIVKTVTVNDKSYPIWVQFTGMTKAISDQEIRARVSGRLEKSTLKMVRMLKREINYF